MRAKRLFVPPVAVFGVATLLSACSGGTTSAKTSQFCQDVASLNKATDLPDASARLAAFKASQSTIDDMVKHAPSSIAAAVQRFSSAVGTAVANHDTTFQKNPSFTASVLTIAGACAPRPATTASH